MQSSSQAFASANVASDDEFRGILLALPNIERSSYWSVTTVSVALLSSYDHQRRHYHLPR